MSAVISWFISRTTANKEIEKLRLTWEREDIVSSDEDFAEMSAAVAEFVSNGYHRARESAMAKAAAIRSKESGEMADALDRLYRALANHNIYETDEALSRVIKEKRKAKR